MLRRDLRRLTVGCVVLLATHVSGVGTHVYADFNAASMPTSMTSSPGPALVLDRDETFSGDALGPTSEELIAEKAISDDASQPNLVDGVLVVSLPRPSPAYGWQKSPRAPQLTGLDELLSEQWCDDSPPGAFRLTCGGYATGQEESHPPSPAALSVMLPRDSVLASTACAGMACHSTADPAAREAGEGLYSALAPRLEISAPNQLRSLPAPKSGWVDMGYTPQGSPVWRQMLAVMCESARPSPVSALGVQCGLPSVSNTGIWRMSFQAGGLEGAFSAKDWHFNVGNDDGISVLVASALQTPLDDFDVDPSSGVQITLPGGLQILGTSSGVDLVQFNVSFGQAFAGVTPLGPIGGVQFDGDTVSGNISALASAGGTQIIGDVTVQAGDFTITSQATTSDFSLGVSHTIRNGSTIELGWSSSDGLLTAYLIRGGPAVRLSWSNDNGFKIAITSYLGLGSQPIVAPQSGMALGFTPASAVNMSPSSVDFRWALAQSSAPKAPSPPAASATVVIRFCTDRVGDSVCRAADSHPPLQVLVDGQSVTTTDGRISVAPGRHTFTVPVELIPPHLAALSGLTCDLTVAASTVGFCDLPVHSSVP